jgi:hypothetical protein
MTFGGLMQPQEGNNVYVTSYRERRIYFSYCDRKIQISITSYAQNVILKTHVIGYIHVSIGDQNLICAPLLADLRGLFGNY